MIGQEINPGDYYNPITGYYTVPYNGIYQFHVHITAYSSSSNLDVYINVDGSYTGSHMDTWYEKKYRSATVLLDLQAGQLVSVMAGAAYGSASTLRSYFHGYMIAAN